MGRDRPANAKKAGPPEGDPAAKRPALDLKMLQSIGQKRPKTAPFFR